MYASAALATALPLIVNLLFVTVRSSYGLPPVEFMYTPADTNG